MNYSEFISQKTENESTKYILSFMRNNITDPSKFEKLLGILCLTNQGLLFDEIEAISEIEN